MSVLLVDDDVAILRAYKKALASLGMTVETTGSGEDAIELVKSRSFEAILCDISMPGMTGIEFLRNVRAHDLDVPVILMTGEPNLESAIRAVEYGAFRYLTKPIENEELRAVVTRATGLRKMADLKREAMALAGPRRPRLAERIALDVRFSWGMSLMWIAFQPIVAWHDRSVFGYEALLRSDEPLMANPADMLDAAERLERLHELGRAVRASIATKALEAPRRVKLFVNLHSADLNDDDLFAVTAPLSRIADRIVLEVTERASLHRVTNLSAKVTQLESLGFQIAVDDLGAGYAGLTSFTQLEPTIAKLDMSLVRGVDSDPRRQSVIRSMKKLCDELNMLVVAEGVETVAERDALAELGCDLLQGYLFAKPQRAFEQPKL